jgi:hypothetical protein
MLYKLAFYTKKIFQRRNNKKKPQPRWLRLFFLAKLRKVYAVFSLLANLELENRLLNLSIRPAVSTNFILPVKNGWENEEISNLIKGYSFPSSQVIVSLDGAKMPHRMRNL